jgi:hypothetical protein
MWDVGCGMWDVGCRILNLRIAISDFGSIAQQTHSIKEVAVSKRILSLSEFNI